jgi:general secretion pathway protein G
LIQAALEMYALNNNGKYPDTLETLVTPDVNGATYLHATTLPLDPWKRPYVYEPPSPPNHPNPRIYSLGADGKPGGEGENADIEMETGKKGR